MEEVILQTCYVYMYIVIYCDTKPLFVRLSAVCLQYICVLIKQLL